MLSSPHLLSPCLLLYYVMQCEHSIVKCEGGLLEAGAMGGQIWHNHPVWLLGGFGRGKVGCACQAGRGYRRLCVQNKQRRANSRHAHTTHCRFGRDQLLALAQTNCGARSPPQTLIRSLSDYLSHTPEPRLSQGPSLQHQALPPDQRPMHKHN